MTPKLVARVIVFIVFFLLFNWLIESSSLVSVSVSAQVDAGSVVEADAPRLAALLEYGVAAVLAIFAASHSIGDRLSDLLVKLWGVVKSKVLTTYHQDSQDSSSDLGLDPDATIEFLRSLESRVAVLEAARDAKPAVRKRSQA